MATVLEVTDALAATLVPVPSSLAGFCRMCHRWSGTYERCASCHVVRESVTHPCDVVVPVTLMGKHSQPYTMLKGYKSAWDAQTRRAFSARVAALLTRLLREHGECIAQKGWDVITHVPSKGRHEGAHPLAQAMELVTWLSQQHETLLERGAGEITRRHGADDGFVPTADVRGRRVVVIDDTWTTGATAQSAASALTSAGASVVAIVPVGRLVDPRPGYDDAAWWEEQRKQRFAFDKCALESHRS